MSEFNADEFMRGEKDCMNGEPHKSGQTESYDRGYSTRYELEQVKTNISEQMNG